MSTSTCVSSGTTRGLLRMEEEAKASEWQGIGSILGSEPERPKTAASLRRTLSADMSSKKLLGRHGFTPLKKIPSSESFPVPSSVSYSSSSSSSSEGEEDEGDGGGQFDNWSLPVQTEKQQEEDHERPGLSDIWGSILSQKADDSSKSSSALYIPPPVKRSKSSLSQKSLEVCTESLGSETGTDGFSSCPPSKAGEFEDKSAKEEQSAKETEQVSSQAATIQEEKMELGVANYDCSATRKSTSRSIPPPLPSLTRREGPGFLMRSHRRDGRLVLEAVPVSSYNYFRAKRQGGRLLLSLINKPSEEELMEIDDEEEVEVKEELELEEDEELDDEVGKEVEGDVFDEFQGFEEEEGIETVENFEEVDGILQDGGIVKEVMKGSQPTVMVPCEVINGHRSATTLTSKLMGFTNRNPTWSHSHKNVDLLEEEEEEEDEMEEESTQLPQSLPSAPRVACLMPSSPTATAEEAASFNAYVYFWRRKPSAAAAAMPATHQPPPPPPIADNNNYCYYPNKVHNNKNKSNNHKKSLISKGCLKSQERQKQMQVLRGNEADCLVPPVRGCKEPRRSIPIWQPPCCIATSS